MRTPFLARFLVLVLLWLGSWQPTQATHVLGGDLTYTYISGTSSQYHVVLRLYARDPALGVPDESGPIQLNCMLNSCSPTAPGSFSAMLVRTQVTPSPSGCTGTGLYSRFITFEADVRLPPGRWTLSTTQENRSFGSRNLVNSGTFSFYLSAFLDNTSGQPNSSPRFSSFTMPYACASQPYRHSFSAFEPDGDSLVYRSVQPLSGTFMAPDCGTGIPYGTYASGQFQDPVNGQTATYPAGSFLPAFPVLSYRVVNGVAVPQFDLNAASGELLTTPVLQVGTYNLAVRADEYRRVNGVWTQIGSVVRDVVYSVLNGGGNRNPTFTSLLVAGASAPQPFEQPIVVQPGQTVSLTLAAADPDAGQAVRLASDAATVIPGATFQLQGTNQGLLTWQVPAALQPGRYSFTASVTDNNCAVIGNEVRTITFLVPARPLANQAGKPQVLTAYPMPFHDRVQFQLPTATQQAVVIIDNLGRTVATLLSAPDGTVQWHPAADVAQGTYFARPRDGKAVFRLLRQ